MPQPYSDEPRGDRLATAAIALAYGLAIALLIWRWLSSEMHYDSALIGLMAQSFLDGHPHPFFFGNNYMGTLDAVLLAPVLALFGPSTLTVNLLPPVLYLGMMVVIHHTAKRLFGPWGVALCLLWLAVPPGYGLFFAGEARTHYGLGLLLSALLMLLSLRLARDERPGPGGAFAWGLVAGLALWTNFLSAETILPCALFLLVAMWRRLSFSLVLWCVAGALLGALPLLAYNMAHGWPHLGLHAEFRLGPATGVTEPLTVDRTLRYISALFHTGLPVMLGVISPHERAVHWGDPNLFTYLALALAVAVGCLGLIWRSLRQGKGISWVPVATILLALGAAAATTFGSQVEQARPRYLLWVLLGLPFVWAWWGDALGRRSRWLALAAGLVLVASNAAGYAGFIGYWGEPLLSREGGFYFKEEEKTKRILDEMRQAGIHYLYADEQRQHAFLPHERPGAYELAFLADGDPVVADFTRDKRPRADALVDASLNPGFLRHWMVPLAEMLGLKHDVWHGKVHWTFAPPQVGRVLEPQGWSATTLGGEPLGSDLWDANIHTHFVAPGSGKKGPGVVLDLGREQEISGFALIPTTSEEIPRSLMVEAAGEDGAWQELRRVTGYRVPFFFSGPHPFVTMRYARVECYFPPRSVRSLRLTMLQDQARHWSIQEVLVFAPGDRPRASWNQSWSQVMGHLDVDPAQRVYADAWASARARLDLGPKVWSLPSNRYVTVYGDEVREDRPIMVEVGQGSAVVVDHLYARDMARTLDEVGVLHQRRAAGRLEVFSLKGRGTWQGIKLAGVSSSVNQEAAAELAVEGAGPGRWTSKSPQHPGVHLDLDLGQAQEVGWVRLGNPSHPHDYPRELALMVSDEGETWREADMALAGPLSFTGQMLVRVQGAESLYRVDPPVKARHLRLELRASDPTWWWSVEEVAVAAPRAER